MEWINGHTPELTVTKSKVVIDLDTQEVLSKEVLETKVIDLSSEQFDYVKDFGTEVLSSMGFTKKTDAEIIEIEKNKPPSPHMEMDYEKKEKEKELKRKVMKSPQFQKEWNKLTNRNKELINELQQLHKLEDSFILPEQEEEKIEVITKIKEKEIELRVTRDDISKLYYKYKPKVLEQQKQEEKEKQRNDEL